MSRAALTVLIALAGAGLVTPAPAEARKHRPKLPPPELASALAVDEYEWGLRLSRLTVAAGAVRVRVYNRGMDDHDLTVVAHDGTEHKVDLKPRESAVIIPTLAAGAYKLFCSLFAGTPQSHEDLGMRATLIVR